VQADELARLEIRVRVTDGTESPPVFRRTAEQLEALIPGATRETIEGAGHVPHLSAPGPYVELTTRALLP
jgi:pimeloyl-ACP methyl ester carboxylesterase